MDWSKQSSNSKEKILVSVKVTEAYVIFQIKQVSWANYHVIIM